MSEQTTAETIPRPRTLAEAQELENSLRLLGKTVRRSVYQGIMLALLTLAVVATLIWFGNGLWEELSRQSRIRENSIEQSVVSDEFKQKLRNYRDAVTEEHAAAALGWARFKASQEKVGSAFNAVQYGANTSAEMDLRSEAEIPQVSYGFCVEEVINPDLNRVGSLADCERKYPLAKLRETVAKATGDK